MRGRANLQLGGYAVAAPASRLVRTGRAGHSGTEIYWDTQENSSLRWTRKFKKLWSGNPRGRTRKLRTADSQRNFKSSWDELHTPDRNTNQWRERAENEPPPSRRILRTCHQSVQWRTTCRGPEAPCQSAQSISKCIYLLRDTL